MAQLTLHSAHSDWLANQHNHRCVTLCIDAIAQNMILIDMSSAHAATFRHIGRRPISTKIRTTVNNTHEAHAMHDRFNWHSKRPSSSVCLLVTSNAYSTRVAACTMHNSQFTHRLSFTPAAGGPSYRPLPLSLADISRTPNSAFIGSTGQCVLLRWFIQFSIFGELGEKKRIVLQHSTIHASV